MKYLKLYEDFGGESLINYDYQSEVASTEREVLEADAEYSKAYKYILDRWCSGIYQGDVNAKKEDALEVFKTQLTLELTDDEVIYAIEEDNEQYQREGCLHYKMVIERVVNAGVLKYLDSKVKSSEKTKEKLEKIILGTSKRRIITNDGNESYFSIHAYGKRYRAFFSEETKHWKNVLNELYTDILESGIDWNPEDED